MTTVAHFLRSKATGVVWSTQASASVYDAIATMAHRQVGALIVVDSGRVAGIITERDYARKVVLRDRSSRQTTVRDVMSSTVHYVGPDHTTEHCMALMTEHRIRYLPVIDCGQVIGMISIGDLIMNVVCEQENTIQQLENYIHGNGFTPVSTRLQSTVSASMVG